jgi:membrane protein implicated in regulation of membrane protease activity
MAIRLFATFGAALAVVALSFALSVAAFALAFTTFALAVVALAVALALHTKPLKKNKNAERSVH